MTTDTDDTTRRLSASELIRQHLEKEISDGVLLPGDALDEEALAKQFVVSRTPVREALLHLSVRGLISIAPRAGIYVSRLSIPELAALLELLAELEGSCAKLATRRLDRRESAELKRIFDESARLVELSDEDDGEAYGKLNAEFHEILYKACRNPALMNEIAHIRRRTQVYRQSAFQSQARIRRSRDDHAAILKAVLEGDAEAACQRMIDHISIAGRDFTDFISSVPQQRLATDVVPYPGKSIADQARINVRTNAALVGKSSGSKKISQKDGPSVKVPLKRARKTPNR